MGLPRRAVPSGPSRRAVLKLGLSGAALLALGGVGLSLQASEIPEPPPLRVLEPLEWAVLVAVADALLPGGDGLPSASELRVADKVDAVLATLHPAEAAELKQVLRLVENGLAGLLLDGRPSPFTRASAAERARVLERWRTSGLTVRRTAYRALAGLCHASYWSDPAVWAFVGYGGPPASLAGGRGDAG